MMKRTTLAVLAVLALGTALVPTQAFADEPVAGVIDATTTSKTNAQATTPFPGSVAPYKLSANTRYSVQCLDAAGVGVDVYVTTVTTSTGVVTATNSRLIRGGALYDIDIGGTRLWIAIKTVSGTANCTIAPVLGR